MSGLDAYIAGIAAGNHTHVTLGGRGVDDALLVRVGQAIVEAKDVVVSVDVTNNAVTSGGLVGFLQQLEDAAVDSVKDFGFENNAIDAVGATAAVVYLQTHPQTLSFQLAGNAGIPQALLGEIARAADWNRQPTHVKKASVSASVDLSESREKLNLTELAVAMAKNPLIVELNVANCELGDHGVEILGGLIADKAHLKKLVLSGNRIGTHGMKAFYEGSRLKDHPSLESLILSNNKLSDEAARLLVDVLKTNHRIVEVDVSDNGVSQSANEMLQRAVFLNQQPLALKLACFALQDNDASVQEIDFQWEANMAESANFLGPALKNNTTVESLNLGNCDLGDKGCEYIAPSLKVNKSLRCLALPNNGILSVGAIALAGAIAVNTGLTELNLANNRIDDVGARALIDAMQKNATLTVLNVEHNDISDELMTELEGLVTVNQAPRGVKQFLPQIESNTASITTIDFSEFDGDRYHNDASARVLSQALLVNNVVTALDLSNNTIGDIGANYLADVLANNKSLKVLRLAQNSLTDRGVAVLAEALLENDTLEELDIRQNKLTDASGEVLLNMLQRNNSVSCVRLDGCRISVELTNEIQIAGNINSQPLSLKLALFRLASRDASFTTLNLAVYDGHRYFTDDSVRILCHALHGNDYVKEINLRENDVGIGAAESLAAVLVEPSCAIEVLSLACNPKINDACAEVLANAFAQNSSLLKVDLQGTSITDQGVLFLSTSLQQNNSIQSLVIPEGISLDVASVLSRELMLNTQTLALKSILPHVAGNHPNLTCLTIQSDGERVIDDTSLQLLCLALLSNNTVSKLDLSNNQITSRGMEYLADLLQSNTTIQHINLAVNRINDEGAKMLTKCLETNNSVTLVELEENPITEHCLAEVYYLLRINSGPFRLKQVMVSIASDDPSLETLDFNGSNPNDRRFDDEAVHVLCSLLVDNHHVRAIDLRSNDITDIGASLLGDLLRANFSLEVLHLDDNCIGVEGAEALFQALKANHALHTLTTSGNAIPDSTLENIACVLHVNAVPLKERQRQAHRNFLALDDNTQFRDTDYYQDKREEITDHGYAEFEMRIRQMKLKRIEA